MCGGTRCAFRVGCAALVVARAVSRTLDNRCVYIAAIVRRRGCETAAIAACQHGWMGEAHVLPAGPDPPPGGPAAGGEALRAARALGPEATVEEIVASGLRGRGGAGFPTGAKWASVRGAGGGTHYAVANAAEGEPATFKDRALMAPILTGSSRASPSPPSASTPCRLHRRQRSFGAEVANLRRAALELGEAGVVGDLAISIVEGPDEYLFGEEKALLEVIEGQSPCVCCLRGSTDCSPP